MNPHVLKFLKQHATEHNLKIPPYEVATAYADHAKTVSWQIITQIDYISDTYEAEAMLFYALLKMPWGQHRLQMAVPLTILHTSMEAALAEAGKLWPHITSTAIETHLQHQQTYLYIQDMSLFVSLWKRHYYGRYNMIEHGKV